MGIMRIFDANLLDGSFSLYQSSCMALSYKTNPIQYLFPHQLDENIFIDPYHHLFNLILFRINFIGYIDI